ncbi:MAG: hypothetical protein OCD76_00710 [Reichenbachiella sp.]
MVEVLAQDSSDELSLLDLFVRDDFEVVSPDQMEVYQAKYDAMLCKFMLKQGRFKSDRAFLEYVFYSVHRKFLKEYEKHALFSEVLGSNGKYDCVTGTALYALFLEDLGYEYEIRETDYHVFLLANGDGQQYLMEATDALNGFAKDQNEINERIGVVLDDAMRINEELAMRGLGDSQMEEVKEVRVINNAVDIRQLAGLHYYNQSLKKFNESDYKSAFKYISVAQGIYPSTRIKNTSSFIFAVAFGD